MQTSEPQPQRRGRKGPWQYQSTLTEENGSAAPAPQAGQARRAFAAGSGPRPTQDGGRLGVALGWLSLGLGLAALLAPRAIARAARKKLDVLAGTRGAARKNNATRQAGEAAVPAEQSGTINRAAGKC